MPRLKPSHRGRLSIAGVVFSAITSMGAALDQHFGPAGDGLAVDRKNGPGAQHQNAAGVLRAFRTCFLWSFYVHMIWRNFR